MKKLEEKIKETIPTLVVFHHAADGDAAKIQYLVDELSDEFSGRASIVPVDCSHDGQFKVRYRLDHYPTWILFKEGQELMRENGEKSKAEISQMIDTAL